MFLDVDLILPRDLEVEMLTPPHRPFTGVPFPAGAGGYRSCSDRFSRPSDSSLTDAEIGTPIVLLG